MAARIYRLRPVQGMLSLNPTVCCQAGSAQAVQQASVHSSEGGTEKLLALTVSVSWRASIGPGKLASGVAPVASLPKSWQCTTCIARLRL